MRTNDLWSSWIICTHILKQNGEKTEIEKLENKKFIFCLRAPFLRAPLFTAGDPESNRRPVLTLKITAGREFRLEYETVWMTSVNSNRSNEPLPSQN